MYSVYFNFHVHVIFIFSGLQYGAYLEKVVSIRLSQSLGHGWDFPIPSHDLTTFLHMRKQSRRSAVQ